MFPATSRWWWGGGGEVEMVDDRGLAFIFGRNLGGGSGGFVMVGNALGLVQGGFECEVTFAGVLECFGFFNVRALLLGYWSLVVVVWNGWNMGGGLVRVVMYRHSDFVFRTFEEDEGSHDNGLRVHKHGFGSSGSGEVVVSCH